MFTRKIFTIAKYSQVVSIPRELLKQLGWKRGQKVVVSSKGKKLQIKRSLPLLRKGKDFKPK